MTHTIATGLQCVLQACRLEASAREKASQQDRKD
nr:MAG TPA: hypothetical protein [Caudoviricetes sp.]